MAATKTPLALASYGDLDAISSGPATPGMLRAIVGIIILGVAVILGGLTVYIGLLLDTPWRLGMLGVNGVAIGALVHESFVSVFRGRRMFAALTIALGRRSYESLDPRPKPPKSLTRSLPSYLLLPRPNDLIKALFFPATYVAGLAVMGWSIAGRDLLQATVALVCLEFLIYQARYQWNDLRGLGEDASSPMATDRKRLPHTPGSPEASVRASIAVICLRLYCVLIVASIPQPLDLATPLWWMFLAVWVLGAFYELLRSVEAAHGKILVRFRRAGAVGVILIVGLGYAVRGVAGFMFAVPGLTLASPVVLLIAGFMWAFGIMFVTLTWVLEGASYCLDVPAASSTGDGRKPLVRYGPSMDRKLHVKLLLIASGVSLQPAPSRGYGDGTAPGSTTAGSTTRPLELRGRVLNPWNAALVVSGGVGLVLAGNLAFFPAVSNFLLSQIAIIAAVGSLASVAVAVQPGTSARWVATCAGLLAVELLPPALGVVAFGLRWGMFAAIIWLVPAAINNLFRASSYSDTFKLADRLRQAVHAAARFVGVLLVGRDTAEVLAQSSDRQVPAPGGWLG